MAGDYEAVQNAVSQVGQEFCAHAPRVIDENEKGDRVQNGAG